MPDAAVIPAKVKRSHQLDDFQHLLALYKKASSPFSASAVERYKGMLDGRVSHTRDDLYLDALVLEKVHFLTPSTKYLQEENNAEHENIQKKIQFPSVQ
jgi:hypothetical protein